MQYDYGAQNGDELSITAGDRITISPVQDHGQSDEWLHGALPDGRVGIFPASYVQLEVASALPPSANPAAAAAAALDMIALADGIALTLT